MCPTRAVRDAARVRSILAEPVALCLWLAAIALGVFGMYAIDDARVFVAVWAAGGLVAVVVADVTARRGR
jgi:hypothetical protein